MCEILIEKFEAIGNFTGKRYIVIITQEILDTGSLNNPISTIKGLKHARLDNGNDINRINDNEFQIIDGEMITRI